ncbi:MAG: histidine ammonia-lyase [Candidatus Marinimicrobia bacterium]|jgi:histidine ammonia-lyase|nr:histidine ammonia-lyase [Candidatus Neomarinimicrobiota bacterium]MCK9483184.1 histidine ammonia-lyase [Candidatus Neomarinimicrobiota bacterium]MCK9558982.1 histidine ammonia-lyase [Candidatus Neomarinimicrobiota bacterium]MDD5540090.1 histidine ammonia-lyase [Candidatus Neomarinimicrobiota bacterium]
MVDQVIKFLQSRKSLKLPASAIRKVNDARKVVLAAVESGQTVYGINTGFGKLSQIRIAPEDLKTLQINLLRSHACGVGEPIDPEIVRTMLYLKIRNLAQGFSGCDFCVIEKLTEFFNRNLLPVVPRQGSVGASGDLAPLAHLALPLIGEGEILYQNKQIPAAELIKQGLFKPIELGPKDGLSLINGTQYSTALLLTAYRQASDLILMSELAAAMSIEAILATDTPFRPEIQNLRGDSGQQIVALHLRNFLRDSSVIQSHRGCQKVQDPYSFRCLPQVLGAVRDTLDYVYHILNCEISTVSDNPLVFTKSNAILSGGNFHAEPLALAADYLTIALAEAGNLAERRISALMDPVLSSLPAFLSPQSGLNSGFMIVHCTAAALAADNRTLSMPASVESIPTSANQEDHVSMAPNAGLKLLRVIENLQKIVWIEFLAAAQGMEMRQPLKGGRGTRLGLAKTRELAAFLKTDRVLYPDLAQSARLFGDRNFIRKISNLANSNN